MENYNNAKDDNHHRQQQQHHQKVAVEYLGRKARIRREQEQNKRREVVRLENRPEEMMMVIAQQQQQQPQPKKSNNSIFIKSPLVKRARKRKRVSASTAGSNEHDRYKTDTLRTAENSDNHHNFIVDRRIPSVSHLTTTATSSTVNRQQQQHREENDTNNNTIGSRMVRVHGLPLSTKRGDIVHFFKGLTPLQIYILPSSHGARIMGWDADNDNDNVDEDSDGDNINKVIVERYPNDYRVYVKFSSAPVATLAVQRSGEIIYVDDTHKSKTCSSNDDDNDHDKEKRKITAKQGASIAVTQITKPIAMYLLKNMAIECTPSRSKNSTILDVLISLEQDIHKLVPKILWSAAKYDLELVIDEKTQQLWDKEVHYTPIERLKSLGCDDTTTSSTPNNDCLSQLVQIRNNLLKDYDLLAIQHRPFPSVALCDCPEMLQNSTSTRLTDRASKILAEKATQINSYLHATRTVLQANSRRRSCASKQPMSIYDTIIDKNRERSDSDKTSKE